MQSGLLALMVMAMLLLATGIARYTRDALHPGVLQVGLWGCVGLCYQLLPHGMRPLSPYTLLLVTLGCLAFALASLAVARHPRTASGIALPAADRDAWGTTLVRPLLFWVALLGLPLFLTKAVEIADSISLTESMLLNLRIALTGEDGDTQTYGLLAYLLPVSFTSTLVELAASRRRGFELKGWVALLVSLGYSVLSTGRTYLFVLFIALAFIALMQRRIRPAAMAWVGLALVGLLFFGMGWLFDKIGEDSPNTNALSALDAFSLYLLGSLAAFDLWLAAPPPLDWGLNVLRSPIAVLASLGLNIQVPALVKEYVYIPEPTNVYTVFLPYVTDFGLMGAIGAFAFFGWLQARLYRAARTGDPRMVILYALSMYPLLLQFFQDQYFSLLTTWVVFAVLVLASFRRVPAISSATAP